MCQSLLNCNLKFLLALLTPAGSENGKPVVEMDSQLQSTKKPGNGKPVVEMDPQKQ